MKSPGDTANSMDYSNQYDVNFPAKDAGATSMPRGVATTPVIAHSAPPPASASNQHSENDLGGPVGRMIAAVLPL